MAEENADVYGTWKIVECVSRAGTVESTGIEGTEFSLDESGDVTWKIPEETEPMAFFNCETFEIFHGKPTILKFFGTYTGHTIEFRVEVSDDFMLLTYEQWCMLQCQRIAVNESLNDFPFSFLGALEEGYFADLTIVSDSGKEFKVHKTVLLMMNIDLDWNQQPPPLSGLPDDVLATILHFSYSECLPGDLTEEMARRTQQSVSKLPGFTRLADLCEIFLKNTALKQQIIMLVSDMHACAARIIDFFNGKGTAEMNDSPPGGQDSLSNNPAKLCYVVKQGLRETAVAGVKLLILCDLFSRRKHELSRQERHDVIKYAMSRLPVFMSQLHKFLEVIRQTIGDLSPVQRHEIATYLVPEIESTLDVVSDFVVETKSALEHMITMSSPGERSGQNQAERNKRVIGEALSRSLKNALHMRELMKLKHFHEKITMSFTNLIQKKENFSDMTTANKVRSVANNLAYLDEIPVFLLRLEEIMSALHEKLTWKEWKYFFKLGTSKVAWMLQKLVGHRSMLRTVLLQLCNMVQRDPFVQGVTQLGLLDPTQNQETTEGVNKMGAQATKSAGNKLNLVESLSIPPLSKNSSLARRAVQLLRLSQATDMVFEIVCTKDATDTVIDHTRGEPVDHSTPEHEVEVHEIKAHRVIVAARCDWFRRALLSGMRESIEKKIVVHDTNPVLFRMFLEYLYDGQLETSKFTTEQLADLMLLSDQYEVDALKQLCEHALKSHMDEGSALFLLGIADQFNVKSLRMAALDFVAMNPDIIESEVFFELPEDVQSEVEEMIAWIEPRKAPKARESIEPHFVGAALTPSSASSSLEEVQEKTCNLHLSNRETEFSDSSSLEDLPLTQDSARLEACVAQLRDIVGDDVMHEELVRISLAADYDANRALNFFYAS